MIDRLEALQALRAAKTMGRAAVSLRVTQSAVSKRIAALEAEIGVALIARDGRHVRLTRDAERLLDEARPLLAGLREVVRNAAHTAVPSVERLRVAATDSLLASWLPKSLRTALQRTPDLQLELHAHRGPMLLERVRGGDYELGLCPTALGDKHLAVRELAREAMVIVPALLEPPAALGRVMEVWSIEPHSLTWEAIATRLTRIRRTAGFAIEVTGRLESFAALVQVARAGFAHALVPLGVARELGVPASRLLRVPGLSRPVAALARRSVLERPRVRALLDALAATVPPGLSQ